MNTCGVLELVVPRNPSTVTNFKGQFFECHVPLVNIFAVAHSSNR